MSAITFRSAHESDWVQVADLLTAVHLPLEGARESLSEFIVAWREGELIGCAGLERYNKVGLLRSVAVREAERGTGLGKTLTRQILEQARQTGLSQIVLLTETAQGFFPKFGFTPITRAEVPSEALASVEFTTACPKSAVVMLTSSRLNKYPTQYYDYDLVIQSIKKAAYEGRFFYLYQRTVAGLES